MIKNASPLDGNKTGDYTSVGLFMPMPIWLAHQFPKLPNDRSPAHITFLIVGNVPPEREQEFLALVSRQVRRFGDVICTLQAKDEFKNPSGQSIHHMPIAFSRDMGALRKAVKRELMDAGYDISDRFPNYRPHATLSYSDGDAPYTGPEPTGTFSPVLEVWGMSKVHRFPFKSRTADLSPSLGLPTEAGPCYLAERVYRNVRNPRVRDQLIAEIEEGGRDFDGKDEQIVYDLLAERGPNNSKLVLTPHTQRRMDERGITVQDIRSGIKNWQKWLNREKSMQTPAGKRVTEELEYGRKLVWEDPKDRLTIVLRGGRRKNEFAIISVFWTDFYNTDRRPKDCPVPEEPPKNAATNDYKAAGVCFMRDNKILLVRRGITAPWMPGSWTLVVGGVEKGESPAQAAKREAYEETKLKPTELKLLGVANSPGEDTVHIFLSRKFTGEVELDWENDAFEWVGRDTLDTYALPRLQRWFAYKAFEAFGSTKVTTSSQIQKLARVVRADDHLKIRRGVLAQYQEARDAVVVKVQAKKRNGALNKAEQKLVANGQAMQDLGEYVVAQVANEYDSIIGRMMSASRDQDAKKFGEGLKDLRAMIRSHDLIKRFQVIAKNRRIYRVDTPLRAELKQTWGQIIGARDNAETWLKRHSMSDAKRDQSDAASRRMRQRWAE